MAISNGSVVGGMPTESAVHRDMRELETAMREANKLANTGWAEVIDAGCQSEAKYSINSVSMYLRRWNVRQMRFEPPVIDASAARRLTEEVRHG